MVIIRWVLGRLILLYDWMFTPKGITRDAKSQEHIDQQTEKLSLYQYEACPFCVKVRRSMKRNSLNIQTHDPKRNETARKELVNGGGKLKVPCLRIEKNNGDVKWMYESSDIIKFLNNQFSAESI